MDFLIDSHRIRTQTEYELNRYLQAKWPQINAHTKLVPYPSMDVIWEEVDVENLVFSEARYADRRGWKPYFWRVLGVVFRRPDWFRRGQIAILPLPRRHHLRMETFGTAPAFAGPHLQPAYEQLRVSCVYYPPTDTLYVLDRGFHDS